MPDTAEGFRDIPWATRRAEIPWNWSDDGFGAPCAVRADEDLDLCGLEAGAITYTFRHSLLYGVRIDYAGPAQNEVARRLLEERYPPAGPVDLRGTARSWRTAATSIWLDPAGEERAGMIGLWSRHPLFPDDIDRPLYLALPPALNSFPGPFQPRLYVCYRASSPIAIDGRIDEKAWRDAPWSKHVFGG